MANPYYNNSINNSQGQGMNGSRGQNMNNSQAQGMNGSRGQNMNGGQGMNMQAINNAQAITNQNPYINKNSGFSTAEILTGLLVGAAATYVLTNENVQKTLFKGALSITDVLSGGLDEMKERFEDAKAEREAEKEA